MYRMMNVAAGAALALALAGGGFVAGQRYVMPEVVQAAALYWRAAASEAMQMMQQAQRADQQAKQQIEAERDYWRRYTGTRQQ